ncbi:MAG TPA: STAS domain-containing protein [Tepidisphaeraceae bacterium]|jgi:anti-anti-sigma factor
MSFATVSQVNQWTVIRFSTDRLTDPFTVNEITTQLERAAATLPLRCQVAVSFSGVEFVSSQVIGLLLGLRETVTRRHGTLVLCKLGKHVLDVLKITKLDRQFTISDSLSKTIGIREKRARRAAEVEWMD